MLVLSNNFIKYSMLIKSLLLIFIYIILSSFQYLYAQNVGINSTGNAPDPSAMLDVSSSNSGILIPRLSQLQRNAIDDPATGLMIYQTDYTPGFYYYDGTDWIQLKKDIKAIGTFTSWSGGRNVLAYSDVTLVSNFKYNLSHTDYDSKITITHSGIYEISYQIEASPEEAFASVGIAINGITNGLSVSKLETHKPALGSTIVSLNTGDYITLRNLSYDFIFINGYGVRLTVKKID